MAWDDYSSAPEPGTAICAADQVDRPVAIDVIGPKGSFPLLLMRSGAVFRAYVNACPHQYLPLNYRGEQILSADGRQLLCTAHGARFDIDTGQPLAGADCGLDHVPIEVVDGMLRIARP